MTGNVIVPEHNIPVEPGFNLDEVSCCSYSVSVHMMKLPFTGSRIPVRAMEMENQE